MTSKFNMQNMAAMMALAGMAMRQVDEENEGDDPWFFTKQPLKKEPHVEPVPLAPESLKKWPETRQQRRARERKMK